METQKTFTVEELLEITIQTLREIPITIGQTETIGKPIMGCINNIQACIDALNNAKGQKSEGNVREMWSGENTAE